MFINEFTYMDDSTDWNGLVSYIPGDRAMTLNNTINSTSEVLYRSSRKEW